MTSRPSLDFGARWQEDTYCIPRVNKGLFDLQYVGVGENLILRQNVNQVEGLKLDQLGQWLTIRPSLASSVVQLEAYYTSTVIVKAGVNRSLTNCE